MSSTRRAFFLACLPFRCRVELRRGRALEPGWRERPRDATIIVSHSPVPGPDVCPPPPDLHHLLARASTCCCSFLPCLVSSRRPSTEWTHTKSVCVKVCEVHRAVAADVGLGRPPARLRPCRTKSLCSHGRPHRSLAPWAASRTVPECGL